jgi:hypothetical protein
VHIDFTGFYSEPDPDLSFSFPSAFLFCFYSLLINEKRSMNRKIFQNIGSLLQLNTYPISKEANGKELHIVKKAT